MESETHIQEGAYTHEDFAKDCKQIFAGIFNPDRLCIDLERGDTVTVREYMRRRCFIEITPPQAAENHKQKE